MNTGWELLLDYRGPKHAQGIDKRWKVGNYF